MSGRSWASRLLGRDSDDRAVDVDPSRMVEVVDVDVRRGRADVVRGVSLTVAAGELVALVGPNGAGKSTLLAAISGDLGIAAGEVRVCGAPLGDWSHGELGRRRAMLLQQNDLAFPFTVETVVGMGRAPWAARPEEDDDLSAIEQAMRDTDVLRLRHRPFTQLSGGERARVSLARVAAQRAPVMLLDEPTASLDLQHQEVVLGLARTRADAGTAVVVVLHDLGLAAAYADRIAVMDEGRIVAVGPPSEVMTAELIGRVYRQDVEVIPHPRTGTPVVVARR